MILLCPINCPSRALCCRFLLPVALCPLGNPSTPTCLGMRFNPDNTLRAFRPTPGCAACPEPASRVLLACGERMVRLLLRWGFEGVTTGFRRCFEGIGGFLASPILEPDHIEPVYAASRRRPRL